MYVLGFIIVTLKSAILAKKGGILLLVSMSVENRCSFFGGNAFCRNCEHLSSPSNVFTRVSMPTNTQMISAFQKKTTWTRIVKDDARDTFLGLILQC